MRKRNSFAKEVRKTNGPGMSPGPLLEFIARYLYFFDFVLGYPAGAGKLFNL